MAKSESWLKEHAIELVILVLVAPTLVYLAKSSVTSEQRLAQQSEELKQVRQDLAALKKSFVSSVLDKNASKKDLIESLVSSPAALRGAERFEQGQYAQAIAIWKPAAASGNHDSAVALAVASAALKQRAADAQLSATERRKAQAALAGMSSGVEELEQANK